MLYSRDIVGRAGEEETIVCAQLLIAQRRVEIAVTLTEDRKQTYSKKLNSPSQKKNCQIVFAKLETVNYNWEP